MRNIKALVVLICCIVSVQTAMAQPAGNYGNIQLNRNALFDTPGSDSLNFNGSTGTLQVTGHGMFTGNLGLGFAASGVKLDVGGNLRLGKDGTSYTARSITLNNGVNGLYGYVDISNRGLEMFTTSNNGLLFGANSADVGVWFPNGNLRIGTTNPLYGDNGNRLQVEGDADVSGKLGVGTASPATKLHLVGDQRVDGGIFFNDANGLDGHKWGVTAWDNTFQITKRNSSWGYDFTAFYITQNGEVATGVMTIDKTTSTQYNKSIILNNTIAGSNGDINVGTYGFEIGSTSNHPIIFNAYAGAVGVWYPSGNLRLCTSGFTDNGSRLQVDGNSWMGGTVKIATTSFPSTGNYKLAVGGNIIAEKVRVKLLSSGWPDYVFGAGYKLLSLKETEQFIKANSHLPGVPSAAIIEKDGLDLGDGQAVLLKKIEELTLHIIEMDKRVEKLENENRELKRK
jgi:hypothetical protein